MKSLTHYNVLLLVGIVTIFNVVVMADVYYFDSNEHYTSEYCSSHEIGLVVARSKIHCGFKCGRNSLCRGIVYKHETMTCKEIHINNFPDRRCQTGSGDTYSYFARKVPVCSQYLISGPYGVDNSQMSESTYYCDVVGQQTYGAYCNPTEVKYYSAWYARLGSLGVKTGGWTPYYQNAHQHVQVEFHQPKIVSAVVLTGRDIFDQYVTSFQLLYSDDCISFKHLTYGNGNIVILQGNSDGTGTVVRHLPEIIEVRCLRINPLSYVSTVIAMRFDLIGCS